MKREIKSERQAEPDRSPDQLLTAAERDSQNLFTGAFGFLLKNYRASNTPQENKIDAIEKWGSIIGRTLGVLFVIILLINLFTGWFF